MENVVIKVDGVGVNATHFAAMKKEEAVAAMIRDGISKDEKWAGEVYDEAVKAIADAKKKTEKPKPQAIAITPELFNLPPGIKAEEENIK